GRTFLCAEAHGAPPEVRRAPATLPYPARACGRGRGPVTLAPYPRTGGKPSRGWLGLAWPPPTNPTQGGPIWLRSAGPALARPPPTPAPVRGRAEVESRSPSPPLPRPACWRRRPPSPTPAASTSTREATSPPGGRSSTGPSPATPTSGSPP